eukprot:83939-Hanusia_phi.AAC.8
MTTGGISFAGKTLTNAKLKDLNGLPHVPLPQKLLNPNVKDDSRPAASHSDSLMIPSATELRKDIYVQETFGRLDGSMFQSHDLLHSKLGGVPNGDATMEGYIVCGDVNQDLASFKGDSEKLNDGQEIIKEPIRWKQDTDLHQTERKHTSRAESSKNQIKRIAKDSKEKVKELTPNEADKLPTAEKQAAEANTIQLSASEPVVIGLEDSHPPQNEKQQDKSDASSVIETISNPADDEQGFYEFSSGKGVAKKKRIKPSKELSSFASWQAVKHATGKQKEDFGFTQASEEMDANAFADSTTSTIPKQQSPVHQPPEAQPVHILPEQAAPSPAPKHVKHQDPRANTKDVKDGKDTKVQKTVQNACSSAKKHKAVVHKKQQQQQQQKKTKIVVSSDEEEDIAPSSEEIKLEILSG